MDAKTAALVALISLGVTVATLTVAVKWGLPLIDATTSWPSLPTPGRT